MCLGCLRFGKICRMISEGARKSVHQIGPVHLEQQQLSCSIFHIRPVKVEVHFGVQ